MLYIYIQLPWRVIYYGYNLNFLFLFNSAVQLEVFSKFAMPN